MDFSALGCWMGGSLQSTCSQLCHKLPTVRYELLRYSLGICAFFVNFWYVWLSVLNFNATWFFGIFTIFITTTIIIIFVLTSVFHACMGWTVSYERLLFYFRSLLIASFQVFLGYSLGTLTMIKHSLMLSPHDQTIAVFYPVKILSLYKIYNPKFLRNLILRPNTAHQFNHTKSIFPVQYDYIFLFNWSSLTSI